MSVTRKDDSVAQEDRGLVGGPEPQVTSAPWVPVLHTWAQGQHSRGTREPGPESGRVQRRAFEGKHLLSK